MVARAWRDDRRRGGFSAPHAEDELPDAVVRMYRESLDEDGLDFLRRGPRNGAERPAYAQRVHPDAFRRAEHAGEGAQAALMRDGILDNRRHFVGPDAMVYQRGEATEEPLHASIRRGFETAVPGFQPTGFGQVLAELQGLSGGAGPDRLTGDPGEDQLLAQKGASSTEAEGPDWLEAGPLRAKQIEEWSRQAAPVTPRVWTRTIEWTCCDT